MTLPSHLARIVEAEYPRFSDQEILRRRAAVAALLAQVGCDHLVFCGANRFGSVVQWLTQWPVTAEAVGVFTPRERDALRHSMVLTSKEQEVLDLLARNLSNKEIGRAMQIGETTIKWHVKNLFGKLDAGTRKDVVHRARILGLLPAHD